VKSLFFVFFGLFLISIPCAAQDPAVRAQAVEMLERANGLSISPKLPNLERTDEFLVLDTSSPIREGSFTRSVIQGTGRREEAIFGDYHAIDIFTDAGLRTVRTSELQPPEIVMLMRVTPVWLVAFADDDVIYAIVDKVGDADQKLRCIEFATIRGERRQENEICVDAATGTLARQKIGDRTVEYGNFFPFAGALMPGKIHLSVNGIPKLEISQTMVELKDATANVLSAPPNAHLRTWCTTYKRAIGQSMPQPKEGPGGDTTDVAIRGIIGRDGRVHQAVIQSSARADLGDEALALVQQWTFSPALCDGQPNTQEATFIVHFRGR